MKIQVIVNSTIKVGNGESLETCLKRRFGHCLVGIERTDNPQVATEVAWRAAREDVDTIVAVGGDGTVNAVLNGIIGTRAALGIIPTGTANDLATLHHIPKDLRRGCDIILERYTRRSDVISANGWCYLTAGGVGVGCEVARTVSAIKHLPLIGRLCTRVLGSRVYLLAALYLLLARSSKPNVIEIRRNGRSVFADTLSLMVNNQPFLGRQFLMSPGAITDDGLFDVCLIENSKSMLERLSIVKNVPTGRHVDLQSVHTWRAEDLILKAERPLRFFGDGEIGQEASVLRVKLIPRAVNVIVPRPQAEV